MKYIHIEISMIYVFETLVLIIHLFHDIRTSIIFLFPTTPNYDSLISPALLPSAMIAHKHKQTRHPLHPPCHGRRRSLHNRTWHPLH
jgi:hypothetical protein